MGNVIRKVGRFVSGKLLPRTAYPVLRGPLRGAKFILGSLSGHGGGASVYLDAMEPEQTHTFTKTLTSGDVFFDVGANVGFYTVLGSKLVGEKGFVVAFEPVLRNLVYLHQHIEINKCRNVTVVSAACSKELSLANFSAGDNYAEGHLSTTNGHSEKTPGRRSTIVPTVTIDAVVEQLGILPTVIKMDVEGAEEMALLGAQRTLIKAKPKIFLSVHSPQLRTVCLEYLENLGYSFEGLNTNIDPEATEFLAVYKN